MNVANILEQEFILMHGTNSLNKESRIMQKLIKIILNKSTYYNIPSEVITCLVRTRTFMRINYMNRVILDKVMINKRNKFKKFIT